MSASFQESPAERAKSLSPLYHGLLLLDKQPGVTSFDALKGVKRAFATGKVGHTGTLDKFASGLLLLLTGRGLKLASLFSGCGKEYTGTIRFGEETDTLDPEGAVIAAGPVPELKDVEAVLDNFRGAILQAPPAYSAIHINGRRAHELVRGGGAPEMKKRPVTVYRLEIVSWAPPEAVIAVHCSAGTYIRSLARDIALAAGSRAYLAALRRTRVGGFRLEDAVKDSGNGEGLVSALRPLDRKIFDSLSLPYFFISGGAAEAFGHGKPLEGILREGEYFSSGVSAVSGTQEEPKAAGVFLKREPAEVPPGLPDKLLGVIERRDDKWIYRHSFAPGK